MRFLNNLAVLRARSGLQTYIMFRQVGAMDIQDIRLNPALDLEQIRASYAANRFVQIPNVFANETAQQIEQILRQETPWRLIFADPGKGVAQLSQSDIEAMAPGEFQNRMQLVMQAATQNIGFCYSGYQMNHALQDGADPHLRLHNITRYLNSRAFLALGEAILSETGLTKVDAQATFFNRGHFLTRHIDEGGAQQLRAAYTLGFSPGWQTDWGGQLQFIDRETTDVTSAWIPRWNTLTVFDGRLVHSVSPVSNFAGDGRYSIVGWFRND